MGVSKLLAYLPRESSIENDKTPLRFDLLALLLLSLEFVKLKPRYSEMFLPLVSDKKMVDRSV